MMMKKQQTRNASADLHGMKVSHDLSEFESGSTTVLTLANKSILDVVDTTSTTNKVTKLNENENGEMNELINVNMDNDKQSYYAVTSDDTKNPYNGTKSIMISAAAFDLKVVCEYIKSIPCLEWYA